MKMLLSVVLLFSLFFSVTSCPDNCFCEDYRAECHIRECSDQLFTEVDQLVVFGSICENHRYILTNIDSGTKILLKDSKCEYIPNWQVISNGQHKLLVKFIYTIFILYISISKII